MSEKLNKFAEGKGKYLNADIVKKSGMNGKPTKITAVEWKEFEGKNGRIDEKPCLTLQDFEKQLSLNITNTKVLIEAYGSNETAWIGRQITLFVTKREFEGKLVDSISVSVD